MKTAFCFDLDGTVTTTEILPCIGSELGIAGEIETLTRATMDGHIPFEDSFRLRCLILGRVPLEKIREIVNSIPLDLIIVNFIKNNHESCFLVTGNINLWIDPISSLCKCKTYSSTAVLNNGELQIQSVLNKGSAVKEIRRSNKFDRIVAIGDGANDIPMMNQADISIAYGGSHPPVQETIHSANFVVNNGKTLCNLLNML
jgi:phosphoserine phosphatase